MRNRILLIIAVMATFVGGYAIGADATQAPTTTTSTSTTVQCEEDMPCWDCATMGNGYCGGSATSIVNDSVDYTPDVVINTPPAVQVTPEFTG